MKTVVICMVVLLVTACTSKVPEPEPVIQQNIEFKPTHSPTSSSTSQPAVKSNEKTITEEESIKQYLVLNFAPKGSLSSNGKVFAAYKIIEREEKEGMNELYILALVQEQVKENMTIKTNSVETISVSLMMQELGDEVPQVTAHILNDKPIENKETLVVDLQKDIDAQAKAYF